MSGLGAYEGYAEAYSDTDDTDDESDEAAYSPTGIRRPARCDGCGVETSGATEHKADGELLARYCPGCEGLRAVRGIEPGCHEHHRLVEVTE